MICTVEGLIRGIMDKKDDPKKRKVVQLEQVAPNNGRIELTDVTADAGFVGKVGEKVVLKVQGFSYMKTDRDGKASGAGLSWRVL
jgi:hypothetical protein